MKYYFLLFTIFVFYNTTNGQLSKKTWLFGGTGSYYSYNEDYTAPSVNFSGKYTSIDLNASIGYFFINKFTGGIRPFLSTYKGESTGGATPNDFKLGVGPFVRYYFLNEENQFNILADLSYQIGINKSLAGYKPKGKYSNLSIMTGAELFFNSAIGLELLFGYKNQIATFDNSPSAYSSNRRGFQASIGFQIHLEKD